jgi:hypothetical protein
MVHVRNADPSRKRLHGLERVFLLDAIDSYEQGRPDYTRYSPDMIEKLKNKLKL